MTELARISRKSLALALALGLLAAPLAAQETATPAPAEPAAPAPTDLNMGQPADVPVALPTQEQAEVGQVYLSAAFDAWELRCQKTEDGSDPCQLYQLLKDAQGTSVAELNMFALPPGTQAVAGATVLVPLETLLTANMTIGVDAAQPKIYPFTVCDRSGCYARIGFAAEDIAAFKAGNQATLTIVWAPEPDKPVPLTVSLKGFTKAFEAVSAANSATAAQGN